MKLYDILSAMVEAKKPVEIPQFDSIPDMQLLVASLAGELKDNNSPEEYEDAISMALNRYEEYLTKNIVKLNTPDRQQILKSAMNTAREKIKQMFADEAIPDPSGDTTSPAPADKTDSAGDSQDAEKQNAETPLDTAATTNPPTEEKPKGSRGGREREATAQDDEIYKSITADAVRGVYKIYDLLTRKKDPLDDTEKKKYKDATLSSIKKAIQQLQTNGKISLTNKQITAKLKSYDKFITTLMDNPEQIKQEFEKLPKDDANSGNVEPVTDTQSERDKKLDAQTGQQPAPPIQRDPSKVDASVIDAFVQQIIQKYKENEGDYPRGLKRIKDELLSQITNKLKDKLSPAQIASFIEDKGYDKQIDAAFTKPASPKNTGGQPRQVRNRNTGRGGSKPPATGTDSTTGTTTGANSAGGDAPVTGTAAGEYKPSPEELKKMGAVSFSDEWIANKIKNAKNPVERVLKAAFNSIKSRSEFKGMSDDDIKRLLKATYEKNLTDRVTQLTAPADDKKDTVPAADGKPPADVKPAGAKPAAAKPAADVKPPAAGTSAGQPQVSKDTVDRLQKLAGIARQAGQDSPAPDKPEPPAADKADTGSDTKSEPEKVQPWSAAGMELRKQQLAKMDPEQRLATKDRAMRMVGHEPTDTAADLVKGLAKYAQAPRGSMVQRTGGYRSMFREMKEYLEAQGLLGEELTLDEFMQVMTETTYGQTMLNEMGKVQYDDDDAPSNVEPIKIPKGRSARKGDGLGCRDHVNCRHNHKANDGEHSRTIKKKVRRRDAKQQHPRNLDELSTDTLKKYIKGAAGDIGSRSFGQGLSLGVASMTDDDAVEVPTRDPKISKRERGIATALGKLTKNKMNEVGKDTLKSYLKKAIPSAEKMAHKDKVSDTMASDDVTSSFGQMDVGQSKAELQHKAKLAKRKRGITNAIDKLEEKGAPQMEEAYTLEEWMGIMQEAMGGEESAKRIKANMSPHMQDFYADLRKIDTVKNFKSVSPDVAKTAPQNTVRRVYRVDPAFDIKRSVEEWVDMVKEMDVNTLKEFFGKWHNANTPEDDYLGSAGSFDAKQAGYDMGDDYGTEPVTPPNTPDNGEDDLPLEETYTLEEWMGMLEELGMEESADVTFSDTEQNPEDTEAGKTEFQNTATHRAPVQIPTATKHPTLYKPEEEPVDTPMSRELRAQHPPVKIEETLNENAFVARMQVLAGILPQSY